MADQNAKEASPLGPINLSESLKALGFIAEERQAWTLWHLEKVQEAEKSPANFKFPWRLEACELEDRKSGLSIQKLEMLLDREQLLINLGRINRKFFGNRTDAEFVFGTRNELWCLFEFTRPGTTAKKKTVDSEREKIGKETVQANHLMPHGVGGFSVRLRASSTHFEIIVSDHFGIGFIPAGFGSAVHRFIAEALGLRDESSLPIAAKTRRSIYELALPLAMPLAALLRDRQLQNVNTASSGLNKCSTPSRLATNLMVFTSALSASRQTHNAIGIYQNFGWQLLITNSTSIHAPLGSSFVPMEVLETKERSGRYGEIDAQILAGKYSRALAVCHRHLETDAKSLYIIRRLSLLRLLGYSSPTPHLSREALKSEPDNKLFLSSGVMLALQDGRLDGVLSMLSRLGAQLMTIIPNADNLRSLDLVIPELLGDAWCIEDRAKAAACYLRIIQRRGDLPRVLRKLIHLTRLGGQVSLELEYLERLAKVERRRTELAKIFVRLMELRIPTATSTATLHAAAQLGMEALKNDKSHVRAALMVAEILLKDQRPEEAIQLLDNVLREGGSSLSIKAKGKLEAMIARVWFRELGRHDLAETRYEHALSLDRDNVEAMRDLEAIYRKTDRVEALVGLLEAQFSLLEEKADIDSLRFVFDELVTLYRGVLGQPRRALDLYQRLIGSYFIEPEEIDKILAWRDIEIDWRDFYGKLLQRLPCLPNGVRRAQYLCRLGEICRDKLHDSKMALHHWLDALTDGWLDSASFQFISAALAAAKDYSVLARCYEQRIDQVAEPEKKQLILELLAMPKVLPDDRRDALALKVYVLDPSQEKALRERFRYYQEQQDLNGMALLIERVTSESRLSNLQKISWLHLSIELLESYEDHRRYNLLDAQFRRLLEIDEDHASICQQAIKSLKGAGAGNLAATYLLRLLQLGLLPEIDEKHASQLLVGHEQELAIFHQLLSLSAGDSTSAATHARLAVSIYGALNHKESKIEEMLGRQCTLAPSSEDELTQLTALVEKSENWDLLAEVLHKQAEFADESERRYTLLMQLGEVFHQKLGNITKARAVYQLCLKYTNETSKIKLLLLQLAGEDGDEKAERKIIRDLLKGQLDDVILRSINELVARLLKLKEDPRRVQKILQPQIDRAVGLGQNKIAAALSQSLLLNKVVSTELYKTVFRGAVLEGDLEKSTEAWWRGIADAGSQSKVKAYIQDSKIWLEREGKKELLTLCLKTALARHLAQEFTPETRREILIHYGEVLFDDDQTRKQSLVIFREAHMADPDDSRTWMPLYFLWLEFGTKMQRLKHLQEIMPKLDKDPRPLKPFPLTIESLKAELTELLNDALKVTGDEQFQDFGPILVAKKKSHLTASQAVDLEAALAEQEELEIDIDEISDEISDEINDEINDEISEENSDKEAITTTNDHASQMPTTFAKVGGESVDFGGALSSSPLGTSKDFSKNSLSWFESDNQGESLPPLPTSQTKFNLVNEEAKAVEEAENATEPLKKSESFAGHIIPANESHVGMPATDIFAGIALDLGDIQLLHPTDEIQEAVLSIDLNENETSIDLSTPEPPPLGDFGKEFNLQIDRQESRKEDSLTVSNGNEMTELANLTFAMTPQFSLAEDAAPLRSEDDNPTEIDRLWRESAKVVSRAKRGISTDQALSEDSDIGKAVVPPEIPVAPQKEEKVGSKKGDEGQGLGPISLSLTNTPGTASRLTGETTGQTAGTNSANAFGPSKANSQLIGQEQTSLEGMTSLSQNSRVSSLNSKTGSNQNNGSTFVLEGDLQEDVGDWRALISKNTINKNTPKRLLSQAFASEIEKHVAIQIVSLIAGNLESLSGWHWRVWRKPEEYGYPLAGKDRYPSGFGGTILNGPLHRMVIALAPLLIRLYYDRFNTKYLAARLEVPLAAIEKMRRPLTWEKGLLQAVGFEMYASRMSERRYMAFNLPGLNKEIFYEGSTRTLYLDEAYYQKSPPSHLFHRLLGILWSVRINYFIPLALDPRRHVLPLLSDMNEYFSARGLSKIKSALKVKKPTIKALSEMDTNQLRVLHQKAGMPTEVVVAQLWEVMRAHILRLLIAETLDIVGVFESVLDKDLLKEDALKPNEIFQRSHFSRMLIEFITKLKV